MTGKVGKPRWLSIIGPALARWIPGLLLLIASLSCLVSPFLAIFQSRQPFPGFLVEPTMVVSALKRPSWAGQDLVSSYPLRIVAVDGFPVSRPAELLTYLQKIPAGTAVWYTVQDRAGQRQLWPNAIRSGHLPTLDTILLFWGPFFVALSYLACGLWVYRARRDDPSGQGCAVVCAAVSIALSLLFDTLGGHHLDRLWVASLPLSAAAVIHLGLVFPESLSPVRRRPWLAWLPYLPAAGLIVWGQIVHTSAANPWAYMAVWHWSYLFISLGILIFLGSLLYTRRFARNARTRQQARGALIGGLLSSLPAVVGFGAAALTFDPTPYLLPIYLPLAIFPFTLAYAIAREDLLDVDQVLGRGLAYSLLAILLAGLYIAIAGLVGWIAPGLLRADDPLTMAFLVILAALLISPLQRYLRQGVDRLLFREQVSFRRVVQEFGQSLAQVMDLEELSQLILQRITDVLHLDAASLYLFDPISGTYTLYEALPPVEPASRPEFAETDPFIERLRVARGAVCRYHPRGTWLQTLPPEEVSRVNQLRAVVFLPLLTKSHLVGWLNLGARRSREKYGAEDLELLDALADRAAVAIENASLFAEHERRLTELAVLNEIGQEINSARSLEQVLETIYRETGRVMDTSNLEIVLYDAEKEELSFPIALEGGERVFRPPRRHGNRLGEYLLRTQQPLLIAERVEETVRSLRLDPTGRTPTAWLGVPILHAGRALGVMAVHSHDPHISYDVEDLAILSAIANQAAIAIENARLNELTDQALARRLAEISVLADFARTLATVALDPSQVAEQTIDRAAEALQAIAGILAYYDEAARSFTPLARLRWLSPEGWPDVWHSLLPELLAAGSGTLVRPGSAFPTDTLLGPSAPIHLLCPLIREDALLALLHLTLPAENEPDDDHRRFLRHLADHAAVALENALLYQKQVQQRDALDRRARHLAEILSLSNALRANMELDQVLQFVVAAARDTLGFRVALLSLVDEEDPGHMRRVAGVGFDPASFQRLQAARPPLSFYQGLMRPEFRVSHSYLIGPDHPEVWEQIQKFPGGFLLDLGPRQPGEWNERCGLFIPLRGSGDVLLGVLSVDDPVDRQVPSLDTIEILEIFANQAAVAIENTRLYDALRKAYEAKGESLSLVAHELQVPMGTLWGYAELLEQAGAPVDLDTLRGFVGVLKSNIARLDALVRDLLEVSRIEAGKLRLAREPLDPGEVILDSAATHRPQIERKGLTLTLDVPAGLPPVLADRDRMIQVLENLFSNARKYTPAPGSIAVSARALSRLEELNGAGPEQGLVHCPCVLISIRDTGIGLSRQDQKRLFTRFFRADHPVVHQEGGTGLGLYLVDLLVKAHGGQIWVESQPGQGSTFHLALPVAGTEKLAPIGS